MTQYVRARTSVEVSDYSSYANAVSHSSLEEASGTESLCGLHVSASTTGASVDLTHLDACTNLVVQNTDSLITVRVKCRAILGSTTVATGAFANANPDTFTKAGATFLANGAVSGCTAIFSGTDEAGNTGAFLLQEVTDTVLTAANSVTWTADASDTSCDIEFVQDQCHVLEPGQCLKIASWDSSVALTLISDSGTPSVRITAW